MNEAHEQMTEIARALPTTRHAEVLFTAAAETLGQRAWRVDSGQTSTLYVRDADDDGLVAPWPLVRFRDGEHIGLGQLSIELDDPYGVRGWQPDPPEPAPERAAPSRLRGQRRGELTIGWGQALRVCYDDDGVPIDISQAGNGVPSDFSLLLRTIVDVVRAGGGIVGLADHVAGLDAAARGPARMRPGDGELDGPWHGALLTLRRAVWSRSVPVDPCWIGVAIDERLAVEWATTRAELLDRLAECGDMPIALVPLPAAPALPPAFVDAGFRHWLPMIGRCGVVSHALIRDDAEGLTIVGDSLLAAFQPAEIDERLDELEARPQPSLLEPHQEAAGPPLIWRSVGASFGDGYQSSTSGRSAGLTGSEFDADHHHRWAFRYRRISGADEA